MGFTRLRVELRALRHALEELRAILQAHTEATTDADVARQAKKPETYDVRAMVDLPQKVETHQSAKDATSESKYRNKTILVNGLTLLFVFAYTTIAAFQWHEMRKANEATFKALESQTRPLIYPADEPFENIVTEPEPNKPNSISITFNLRLKNYAKFPTTLIRQEFYLVDMVPRPMDIEIAFQRYTVCKIPDQQMSAPDIVYRGVEPFDGVFSGTDGASFNSTRTIRAIRAPNFSDRLRANWASMMLGCIAYKGAVTETIHHTLIAWWIERSDVPRIITTTKSNGTVLEDWRYFPVTGFTQKWIEIH